MSNQFPERHETKEITVPSNASASVAPRHSSIGRAIGFAVAGLVAAAILSFVMRQVGVVYELPAEHYTFKDGPFPNAEEQRQIGIGLQVVKSKHATLWLGIAGAIAGGLFGLALGMNRRSRTSTIAGTLGGLVFGGAFGAGAGTLAVYIELQLQKSLGRAELNVPEHKIILMHAVAWLVLGLGVGLGSGMGSKLRHCLGSMLIAGIAGALGGALYPIVASFAAPMADPSFALPSGDVNRLVWLGLPFALIGLAIGRRG